MRVLVQVTRGGVVESAHQGALAVADADGTLIGGLGDVDALVFPRSALKPFQALATQRLLATTGQAIAPLGLATAASSHTGTDHAQVEAAHLLACAGLDESALRCPPAWPHDTAALRAADAPTPLAHNCSGKHAAFLWAHTAAGGEPAGYLDEGAPLQQQVRDTLAELAGTAPTGPAVDGCGAPAWRLPLMRVAVAYARLARGAPTGEVLAAMTAHPELVGGPGCADSALMAADARVVAKRGAEGVLAAGLMTHRGPVGVAVKIADGANRAPAPPVAAVLRALGATVPGDLLRTAIPPAGQPQGWVEATPYVVDWAAELPAG
ncbi:MAG: asparaginase [Egibacteraceae bacterium]